MAKEVKKKTTNQVKNKSVSEDLLSSYRGALEKVRDYFDSIKGLEFTADNIDQNMKIIKSVLDSGAALGKNIESLDYIRKESTSRRDD